MQTTTVPFTFPCTSSRSLVMGSHAWHHCHHFLGRTYGRLSLRPGSVATNVVTGCCPAPSPVGGESNRLLCVEEIDSRGGRTSPGVENQWCPGHRDCVWLVGSALILYVWDCLHCFLSLEVATHGGFWLPQMKRWTAAVKLFCHQR